VSAAGQGVGRGKRPAGPLDPVAPDPSRDRFTDADLYTQIDKSQRRIPWWLVIMVGIVILLSVVLNAPFLTGHGGNPLSHFTLTGPGSFLDPGMIMALVYVGGGFAIIFWFTCRRGGS
jgi:hypothetical protein